MNYINLNSSLIKSNVLLVTFQFQATNDQFITTVSGLPELLKNECKNGIESVQMYDSVKRKFVRLSKKALKAMYNETELTELKKLTYYFN